MKILLLALVFTVSGFAMNTCRVVGQELSEHDKEHFRKIEHEVRVEEDEIVACSYNGAWLYARVQAVPAPRGLGYGTINFRPMNPDLHPTDERNTYGGRAIHFKHVRKLAPE